MPEQMDWVKPIVERQTKRLLVVLQRKNLSKDRREAMVRDTLRRCVMETLRSSAREMKGILQASASQQIPRFTTEEAASKIGIALSTLRLYISKGIVTTPKKIANTWRWSEEQIENASQEVLGYKQSLKRPRRRRSRVLDPDRF